MKSYLIGLFLKVFGIQNVHLHIKSELKREVKVREAMDFLLADGKTQRLLSQTFKNFIMELTTGTSNSDTVNMYHVSIARQLQLYTTPKNSHNQAIFTLLSPYLPPDEYPQDKLIKITSLANEKLKPGTPKPQFVKVFAATIISQVPYMPISTANSIANICWNKVVFFKEISNNA